ncbi:MAG: N-acetylglutaminylglutamine amidotransferase [Motiliproteus sp.]
MCGIAGEISFSGCPSVAVVGQMLDHLAHRGPDATGMYSQDNICLGHRRLKIIDLSNHANQPMVDAQLGLTLVFNGCIYNYRHLRQELEQLGYHFFSKSDTEVILKAYAQWGEQCLDKFNGMFSFAIFERDSGQLFVARDRLGIKPFYYFHHASGLAFASTLPALLQHPAADVTIDPVALNHYFSFRAIVGDKTIFKNIKKLSPGFWMKISSDGQIKQYCYWKLPEKSSQSNPLSDEQEWSEKLESCLIDSVKRRLEADVPVGVLLSGGLDSSLIVGLLSQLGKRDIHTFSIGFEQVAEEEGNEFRYSDVIAERYSTRHFKIFANHDRLLSSLRSCVAAMSEPMVSHDVIGFYLLSEKVSQHVKVVQSGQGADEVFGGYHWYPPMIDIPLERAAETYAKAYFSCDFNEYKKLVQPHLVSHDHAMRYVQDYFQRDRADTAIDQTLMLDTEVMLVDDPVKRLDNMTMAFGIEARVPFLDHQLVELAHQMPYELKVRDGGKYLLKQVARRLIPHEVIDRPKGYFPVPGLRNMQGAYLALAKQVFCEPAARERGLFNQSYIDNMLAAPEQFTTRFGSRLWQVTLLELWLQQHLK